MTTIIYHKHHIIPKSLGGSNDESNIVKLTLSGHIAVHKWMYEEYGRWEDRLAYLALSGRIGKEEILRLKSREGNKKQLRETNIREINSNHMKSRWLDPKFRSKMSIVQSDNMKKLNESQKHDHELLERRRQGVKDYWSIKENKDSILK